MHEVFVSGAAGSLAEDKDAARELRVREILPELERGGRIAIDFKGVQYATQSFVHALISDALIRSGEESLERIEFRSCSEQVKRIIEIVVDYSLGGFGGEDAEPPASEGDSS